MGGFACSDPAPHNARSSFAGLTRESIPMRLWKRAGLLMVGALVRGEIVTRWREAAPEQLGDVILLRVRGQPCHVGVVVARGKFLHAFEGTRSCVERYDGLKWRRRIMGFYRYAG
ncbi:C40 family peptidase [bacterium]|nr:C40 family peptidase [bacterium]